MAKRTRKPVAVFEHGTRIYAPVDGERRREVKEALERGLHLADPLADRHLRVEASAQELRGREVIGVRVRLQDEVDAELLRERVGDHSIHGLRRGRAARGVVVEHGVDDHGVARREIRDDVGHREGAWIVEGFDVHG